MLWTYTHARGEMWHNSTSVFAIDIIQFTNHTSFIPRGALDSAEMAVSRTLEPDPGHAGVGTGKEPVSAN
jgi:hypothetical protein